jgi:uncharacterized protein
MTDVKPLTWQIIPSGGFESAWVTFTGTAMSARGRVFGALPEPYWISYELETGDDWITRRFTATADTATATRRLDLLRTPEGWTANGEPLPWAGDGAEALDCDLGLSPLTNSMPVLRHDLHRAPGEHRFLMAWISVPALHVRPSRQAYTHLAPGKVRFTSGDYTSDLEFAPDALILSYPDLAHRLPNP